MGKGRTGVSGWSYASWRGDFYPPELPQRSWLAWLSRRFDTLEANGSFYSLLSPSTYRSWYEQLPAGCRMAVKGSRFITHNKKLGDARVPLANFFASGVLALEEKLGPFLWQLSSRHVFDAARLASFLEMLPRDTRAASRLAAEHDERVAEPLIDAGANHRIRHALEPRHDSFFCEEAVSLLREAGVALAISHSGSWPMREEVTAGFVYVRLHGAPRTYASGYGSRELAAWAEKIAVWAEGGAPDGALSITDREPPSRASRDVYVYFDNDGEGRAPHDAMALAELLRSRLGAPPSGERGLHREPSIT